MKVDKISKFFTVINLLIYIWLLQQKMCKCAAKAFENHFHKIYLSQEVSATCMPKYSKIIFHYF